MCFIKKYLFWFPFIIAQKTTFFHGHTVANNSKSVINYILLNLLHPLHLFSYSKKRKSAKIRKKYTSSPLPYGGTYREITGAKERREHGEGLSLRQRVFQNK